MYSPSGSRIPSSATQQKCICRTRAQVLGICTSHLSRASMLAIATFVLFSLIILTSGARQPEHRTGADKTVPVCRHRMCTVAEPPVVGTPVVAAAAKKDPGTVWRHVMYDDTSKDVDDVKGDSVVVKVDDQLKDDAIPLWRHVMYDAIDGDADIEDDDIPVW